jgi:hypothetical protein
MHLHIVTNNKPAFEDIRKVLLSLGIDTRIGAENALICTGAHIKSGYVHQNENGTVCEIDFTLFILPRYEAIQSALGQFFAVPRDVSGPEKRS